MFNEYNYPMNTTFLLLGGLGTGELIVIALIFLLLFGAKRIPDLMQSLGKGVNSFKKGLKDVSDEIAKDDSAPEKSDEKK